jgi:hypothetical protein
MVERLDTVAVAGRRAAPPDRGAAQPVRPRARMPPRVRKLVLTCHVALSVGWLGIEATQVALGLSALSTGDPEQVKAVYIVMEFIGTTMVAPAAVGSLLTGLLLALGTPWGLFRHYWVMVGLIINVTLVATGHKVFRHWLGEQAAAASSVPETALTAGGVGPVRGQLLVGLSCAVLLLLFVVIISIYKPWGKTRFGRGRAAHQRRVQQPAGPAAAGAGKPRSSF